MKFVITLREAIALILISIAIIIFVIAFLYYWFKEKLSKWKNRKRNNAN